MHYKNAEIHSWISGHEIKYIDTNNLVSNYSLEFIFSVVGNFIFHSHYSLLGLDRSHLSAHGKESDKHWKKKYNHIIDDHISFTHWVLTLKEILLSQWTIPVGME